MNHGGGWTVENVSPKVEGSIAYGLSVGPSIGIYTKAIEAGIGIDSKTKHTLSGSYDLLNGNAADYANWNLVQHLQNADYTLSDVSAFSFYASVLQKKVFDLSTPDITKAEESWKVLPKLGVFPQFERVEDGLELTVWVKNRNLLGGSLKAHVAENPKDLVYLKTMVFPDSRNLIASLNSEEDAPDSVALKGFVHLDEEDPDLNYAEFLYDVSGIGTFNLGSFMQEFNDGNVRSALQGILQDIYKSRASGEAWDKCNWFDNNISPYSMNGVRVSLRGGKYYFKINLKEGWKMSETVTVNDHSKGLDAFGGWEIIFEDGATGEMKNLHIYDSHFTGYYASSSYNHLEQLTINSPIWTRWEDLGSGSRSFKRLDLSNTTFEELSFGSGGYTVKDALILKNCPALKNLKFSVYAPATYDVTGCGALEEISFEDFTVPTGYFEQKTTGTPTANLVISGSSAGNLSFPGNFNEVYFRNSTFDVIEVSGNKSMSRIDLTGSKGNGLIVKDCTKMGSIVARNTGISKFEVKNLPEAFYIAVEDNNKLQSLVPDVFDQIRENGGSVSYDIRYTYTDDGSGTIEYEDNGYGFWYEGEPQCGYHGKEPPKDDEEGYVTHSGDTPARAAFRKVLQDLYRCRKGEWEGCDWLDGSKALGELVNVSAPENASNNESYYVTIPEEWQFGQDVLVKKHNKQATEQYGGETGHYEEWGIIVKGDRYYNSFTINDIRCYRIVASGEAKTFAVHSPSFYFNPKGSEPNKYRSIEIPAKIHTLDLRGSGGYEFDYNVDYEHTPKVFKLRRYDGKNLNQGLRIRVKYTDATPQQMPSISIGPNEDGFDRGSTWIELHNMILPYGDLPISVDNIQSLELYGCTGDMIYMPDNIYYLAVGAKAGYSVNNIPHGSGLSNIKEIKILDNKTVKSVDAGVQEAVTVSGCPALTEASFGGSTISRFTIDNVPALNYLNFGNCPNLTMVVPALFEEVWSRGGTVNYDVRYTYNYTYDGAYTAPDGRKFNYTDNGHGFYYADEPNRGYHR